MRSYLIESYLPRSRQGDLAGVAERVLCAARGLVAEGEPVRYVRSMFLPGDEVCMHLLQADSVELVSEASRRAGVSPTRIIEWLCVAEGDARGGAS